MNTLLKLQNNDGIYNNVLKDMMYQKHICIFDTIIYDIYYIHNDMYRFIYYKIKNIYNVYIQREFYCFNKQQTNYLESLFIPIYKSNSRNYKHIILTNLNYKKLIDILNHMLKLS